MWLGDVISNNGVRDGGIFVNWGLGVVGKENGDI